MNIPIKRFDTSLDIPRFKEGAAAFDFYCRTDVTIASHSIELVPLNAAIQVPEGHVLLLFVRSSTPLRKKLMLANSVGILDPFFNGDKDEIQAELYNFTDTPVQVKKGERLVQGMILKREPVQWDEKESFETEGTGYFVSQE